ncbi:MAG: dihydroorotase, partial [Oscillospiraceae bacterium]
MHHGASVSPVHIPASSFVICPGFVDVHVHLREPGFSYKETMSSGTQAAAHGGYTTVCAMPNLDPVPDSLPHLEQQLALIRRDAAIRVLPYGSITRGQLGEELSDMAAMPHVAAFSDDGRGVQSEAQMRLAMETAKGLHKLIVAHCEDNSLLHGGYIHDGAYARTHGHRGICSESEWGQIRRDLELVRQTGCGYHVCHISTKESVALIRRAKAEGLDVTCETAPHYLLMDETMLQEDGRFKMNPPLRSPADREALLEGLADGTIDMVATDHAPHS